MNIIVLGDIMLDINHICETTRNAPEAPIPIYNITKTNNKGTGKNNEKIYMLTPDCAKMILQDRKSVV